MLVRRSLVIVLLVVTAMGCTADEASAPSPAKSSVPSSGERRSPPLVTQPPGERQRELALVDSTLRYDDERNCVYLDAPRRLPVWPHGYRAEWRGDELIVTDENGGVAAVAGTPFKGSGGYHPLPDLSEPCGVEPGSDDGAVLIGDVRPN